MTSEAYLNELEDGACRDSLERCCASPGWIADMLGRRPFHSEKELAQAAAELWWSQPQDEWQQAFAAHPKIGDVDSLRSKFANTKGWASGEQAGVADASNETIERLAQANRDYEEKFGYIFIVCATGKTADEILTILEGRLPNEPDEEIRIAAAEQLKITQLRLLKVRSSH